MKLSYVVVLVVMLALVGARFYVRSTAVELPDIKTIHETSGVPVRAELPVRMDLVETVDVTGQLEGRVSLVVAFEVDGRLVEVTSRVGDAVTTGQVLARLDDAEQRARVAAAEAALDAARAHQAKAERGARPQELRMAESRRDEAAAGLKVASEELQRVRSLVSKKAASQQQLDNVQAGFDMAQARLVQAQQGLELAQEGTRREDKAAALAAVRLSEAQLELARLALDRHVLKSPLAGVVVARPVEPGDVIKNMPTAQKILEVVEADPILFVTKVSELVVPQLSFARPAEVSVDALPGETFAARLHELTPAGEAASRTFVVKYALANGDLRLKPAMFARSRLKLRESPRALTVPSFVLRDPAGLEAVPGAPARCLPVPLGELRGPGRRAVVLVAGGGLATARAVRAGLQSLGRVEVLEGLDPRSVVIVDGFEELKAGQKVAPTGVEGAAGGEAR